MQPPTAFKSENIGLKLNAKVQVLGKVLKCNQCHKYTAVAKVALCCMNGEMISTPLDKKAQLLFSSKPHF